MMTSMPDPLIKLRNVSKHYPTGKLRHQVLHDVDLEVQEGEFLAVVGTSGSGKSTLLNIIGGLDTHFTGQVEVADHRLSSLTDAELSRFRNEKVGFIFQQFNLLEHLSCAENVALPSVFAPPAAAEAVEERARQALQRVGMEERAGDLPANLSGGQKQRIAIARALFNHPPVLLCDEPTGNLDRKTGQQIIDLFTTLNGEDGRTLIIVTHESRVSCAAHRVLKLEDGRFVERDERISGEDL